MHPHRLIELFCQVKKRAAGILGAIGRHNVNKSVSTKYNVQCHVISIASLRGRDWAIGAVNGHDLAYHAAYQDSGSISSLSLEK